MKKNKRGFTLIELLATVVVLGIIVGIVIYVSTSTIGRSKEKSYQVTINEIEKNGGVYISENDDRMSYVQEESGDYEYQCITVQNLIDYGYLDNTVLNSKISDSENVSADDYVYIERNINTKTVTKTLYVRTHQEYMDKCGNVVVGNGNIIFTANPDFQEWSKYKDVTITYRIRNLNDMRTTESYTFNHSYSGTYKYDKNNDTMNNTTKTKVVRVTSNGKLTADINLDGNVFGDPAYVDIDHIDMLGPVITNNYAGSNEVRHSVTIPLKIIDRNEEGYAVSGVNYDTFTKSDIEVKIGDNVITNHKLKHINEENYNLTINNDTYDGKITLYIDKGKVLDNAKNKNDETSIDTGITFNNTYKITYHGNGGTSTQWEDTWEDTVRYGEEYSTPENKYTRKGYTFNGWNEASNGSGTVWGLNSNGVYEAIRDNGKSKWTWTYTKDIDLYAQWNAKTYTITYNCGTGSGTPPANQTVVYDSNVTISNDAGSCSKTGYNLSNWTSPSSNGTGTSNWKGWNGTWRYDNGEYGISNNTLTLTASWSAKSVVVTFNCNGGTGGGNRTYTYDVASQSFPNPALCSRSGYSLEGWALNSKATSRDYTATSGVSNNWINSRSPAVTIYAVWKSTYSVCDDCYCCCNSCPPSSSGGSVGGTCFLAGTKVMTLYGDKPIEKIKVGDMVLTYNEGTENKEYHRVRRVFAFAYDPEKTNERLYTLTFDDNSTLQVSSTHRFYIRRENQVLWLPTKLIKTGDTVMYADNSLHKVINIKNEKLTQTVYNFSVENAHNYYVGDQQILVHNLGAHEDWSAAAK